MIRLLTVILGLIGFSLMSALAADVAGYVISAELKGADAGEAAVLSRGGVMVPVLVWMPLYAEDSFTLADPGSTLTLELKSEGRVALAGGAPAYRVAAQGSLMGDVWNTVSTVGGLLGGDETSVAPVNLTSKGKGLTILGAAPAGSFISDDGAPLAVAWTGGKAPYSFALKLKGRTLAEGQTADSHAVLAPQTTGSARLIIRDSANAIAELRLTVTPLPEMPHGLDQPLLRSVWLLREAGPGWRLEGLSRLRALAAGGDSVARRLLETALAGQGASP